MPKYTFNMVCTDDKVGDSSDYKKIKLVGDVNGEEKTIKLCGSCIGSYSIIKRDGQEFFELWAKSAKYNFREGDFCDGWTDEKLYKEKDIPLSNVKLKVILDEDCEYKIAVSVRDNQWITLPKSALLGKNLNLGEYYNRELSLSKGEELSRYGGINYYIPRVMCGETKICELAPLNFPICPRNQAKLEGSSNIWASLQHYKIVVEKNDADEPSIYLADNNGAPISSITIFNGTGNIIKHTNSVLKTVLLENSNIREVLPELNIGDGVDIDKRQLKCLVHNIVPKEVAQELVTNKKDALGKAVLEVKNGNEEILVTKVAGNSGLRTAVATNLKGDQGFKDSVKGDKGDKGLAGISPDVGQVAQELVTNKKDELGKAVL